MNTKSDTNSQQDEADELGEAFFANAVLTRPGENIIEVVSRAFGSSASAADADDK